MRRRTCGKPRPAVVVQSDYPSTHGVLAFSLTPDPIRPAILPYGNPGRAVRRPSRQFLYLVGKDQLVPRWKIGEVIGRIDNEQVVACNRVTAEITGLLDDA